MQTIKLRHQKKRSNYMDFWLSRAQITLFLGINGTFVLKLPAPNRTSVRQKDII
jgi:hypothetical protein